MDKKSSFKIVLKILSFIIIGLIILSIINKIFIPKWITVKDNRMTYILKGFYEEPEDSLDVIFMGNSDVYRGISPITIWEEYGIASYNFVSSGQRMWTAYYMLEESLKYQKPKLIVLNMDSAFNESNSSESNYRKAFDNMKFGRTKLRAITDSVYENSNSDVLSYIFPIIRYHSRWKELTDEDFIEVLQNNRFAYKGMDLITDIQPYNEEYKYMERDHSEEKIDKKCLKYLNKIIDLCKEQNIELLLIEIPSAESWSKDLSDKTAEFAKENDLEFIDMNLNANEFGFDWKTDTSDGGDHLNVYGAEKVSKYIGGIIKEKYNVTDHRNEKEYENWYKDSKKYHLDKEELENNK